MQVTEETPKSQIAFLHKNLQGFESANLCHASALREALQCSALVRPEDLGDYGKRVTLSTIPLLSDTLYRQSQDTASDFFTLQIVCRELRASGEAA